ncbi:MAG: hypothetical protein IAI50_16570 [Candidatus Eremiobacteraeota bacterium]|nr:hypothetical protein [Candidatus Eremiobacteraeota bacterium]
MKDRLSSIVRARLAPVVLGFAFALTLAGCSSGHSGSDSTAAGGSQAGAGSGGSVGSATRGRRRMAEVLRSLDLSDEQKQQIREIMTATRKENANADPSTRGTNMRAAYAKISDTVLTPDQRSKFQAKMAQMRKEREQNAPAQS